MLPTSAAACKMLLDRTASNAIILASNAGNGHICQLLKPMCAASCGIEKDKTLRPYENLSKHSNSTYLSRTSTTRYYFRFLDQELILYRYSSSSSSDWGNLCKQQAKASSFRIRSGWNLAGLFSCFSSKYALIGGFSIWRARVTSLAPCMCHSSWSIMHSNLLF